MSAEDLICDLGPHPLREPVIDVVDHSKVDHEKRQKYKARLLAFLNRRFPEIIEHIVFTDITYFSQLRDSEPITACAWPKRKDTESEAIESKKNYLQLLQDMLRNGVTVGGHDVFRAGLPLFECSGDSFKIPDTKLNLDQMFADGGRYKRDGVLILKRFDRADRIPLVSGDVQDVGSLDLWEVDISPFPTADVKRAFPEASSKPVAEMWRAYADMVFDGDTYGLRTVRRARPQLVFGEPLGSRNATDPSRYQLYAMTFFSLGGFKKEDELRSAADRLADELRLYTLQFFGLHLTELSGRYKETSRIKHRLPATLAALRVEWEEKILTQGLPVPPTLYYLSVISSLQSATSASLPVWPRFRKQWEESDHSLSVNILNELWRDVAWPIAKNAFLGLNLARNEKGRKAQLDLLQNKLAVPLKLVGAKSISVTTDQALNAVLAACVVLLVEAGEHAVYETRVISDQVTAQPAVLLKIEGGTITIDNPIFEAKPAKDLLELYEAGNQRWELDRIAQLSDGTIVINHLPEIIETAQLWRRTIVVR